MLGFFRNLTAWRSASKQSRSDKSRRISPTNKPTKIALTVETLEDRLTPSFANLSAYDQLLLELINRARANPSAEAARYGVDLNQGLSPGTISASAKAPLAPQQVLINSAGAYSDDMYARNFFGHVNPEGQWPWDRAVALGYPTRYVGENISWGTYSNLANAAEDAIHERARNFFLSASHRQNMLNPTYNEVGTGVTLRSTPYQGVTWPGLNVSIVSEEFGYRAGLVYLTGVAYTDAVVRNNFYNIGEGMGGVTITALDQSGRTFTTTSSASGGYALQLAPGTYTIHASGGGLSKTIVVSGVSIGSQNVKVDFTPGQTSANVAPQLQPIADQTINRGQSLFVSLHASDGNGDRITYQVSITGSNQLYDLDQSLDLVKYNNNYYENYLGAGDKWMYSQAQTKWYFVLPDGRLYSWTHGGLADSNFYAYLDPAVNANPALLHEATPSAAPNVTKTINGNLLTLTPPAGFGGSFHVKVTASDGTNSTSRSFRVSVRNSAPQLASIGDQQMSHRQETLTVNLNASDPDGDTLAYRTSITAYSRLVELDQKLGLVKYNNNYYENWLGLGDKWFYSQAQTKWYFVLPDGRLYSWTHGGLADSNFYAYLDPSVNDNPALLHEAATAQAPAVSTTVSGNRLTINPPSGFVGSFKVNVTASDGNASVTRSFAMEVANRAPQISNINDQTIASGQRQFQVAVPVTDADGEPLSYGMEIQPYNQPYDLDQRLQLFKNNTYYENWLGLGEKWLYSGTESRWYFVLPDGRFYRWGGADLGTSALITKLDPRVHADPTLLYQAPAPAAPALSGRFNGNLLTLDLPSGMKGTFRVTVTASDGLADANQSFLVTVI